MISWYIFCQHYSLSVYLYFSQSKKTLLTYKDVPCVTHGKTDNIIASELPYIYEMGIQEIELSIFTSNVNISAFTLHGPERNIWHSTSVICPGRKIARYTPTKCTEWHILTIWQAIPAEIKCAKNVKNRLGWRFCIPLHRHICVNTIIMTSLAMCSSH